MLFRSGGAFESLRIEKGYRFAGVDMHTDYTADESGLGFAVNLRKPAFIGKHAVIEERNRGMRKKLVPIVLDDPNAAPLGGEPIEEVRARRAGLVLAVRLYPMVHAQELLVRVAE